jgi:hypothetical protein
LAVVQTRSGDVLIDSAIAGGRVDHASRRPDAGRDSAGALQIGKYRVQKDPAYMTLS